MLNLSIGRRIKRIGLCFTDLMDMVLRDENKLAGNFLIQFILIVMCIVFVCCAKNLLKQARGVWAKTWLVLMILILPIGINIIYPMTSSETIIHAIMRYSVVLLWIIALWCVEVVKVQEQWKILLYKRIVIICTLVSIVFYAYYSNSGYTKVHFLQEQTTSYYTTMITRIKSCEGYKDELPVVYIGTGKLDDATLTQNTDYLIDVSLYSWDLVDWVNDVVFTEYMKYQCGFSPKLIYQNEIEEWEEIDKMPTYPDDGSIRIINEMVVVKFAEREIDNLN